MAERDFHSCLLWSSKVSGGPNLTPRLGGKVIVLAVRDGMRCGLNLMWSDYRGSLSFGDVN